MIGTGQRPAAGCRRGVQSTSTQPGSSSRLLAASQEAAVIKGEALPIAARSVRSNSAQAGDSASRSMGVSSTSADK
ncbi:hypothetical protein FQZ97_1169620 [compost metagenome]